MKVLILAVPVMLAGCSLKVTHATKSTAEMQADIKSCSDRSNKDYWMDPVAALYHTYDCLEGKGYKRSQTDLAAQVERAVGEGRPTSRDPTVPCSVPCKPKG